MTATGTLRSTTTAPAGHPAADGQAERELLASLLGASPEPCETEAAGDEFLATLCTRRLDHARFHRLYLDATYVKSRRADRVWFEAVVAASGVKADGGVEILGLDVGDSEDPRFWCRLLTQLRARGLHGVRVVGSDEHGGLQDAVAQVFPDARWEWSPGAVEPISEGRGGTRPSAPATEWPEPPGATGPAHQVRCETGAHHGLT